MHRAIWHATEMMLRVNRRNAQPVHPSGDYILYWMIAARRVRSNFALQRAMGWCEKLQKPLLVFEPMRIGHRFATQRQIAFVAQGMCDNQKQLQKAGIAYYPYIEPSIDAGKGLLVALAQRSCVVVTDEFPCAFIPHMLAKAAQVLPVWFESIDGNGLLPLRATEQAYTSAYFFRKQLHKILAPHLSYTPEPEPLQHTAAFMQHAVIPAAIVQRWPQTSPALFSTETIALAKLPVPHRAAPVAEEPGGSVAAEQRLQIFLTEKLAHYAEDRNHPDKQATSQLSAYLHHGHLGVHQIFNALMQREQWQPSQLNPRSNGARSGYWGIHASSENFLDELITWRELAYNTTFHLPHYDTFTSLPSWAQATLHQHRQDRREHLYDLATLTEATTHDPLWNAAQRQLHQHGRIHNYLRMLWAKNILQWCEHPEQALSYLIDLNNIYGLDGCNPNSYAGIFWSFGRYDRPWPERAIFGTVRSMTSQSTLRKVEVKQYLRIFLGNAAKPVAL